MHTRAWFAMGMALALLAGCGGGGGGVDEDSGIPDGGSGDAGTRDTGRPDTGGGDAATPDTGPGCTDSCAIEGATQCSGTVVETCTRGADGCLDWAAGTDCADGDQVCDGNPAMCVDTCADMCSAEGDMQCAGDVVQTCEVGADGCLDWVDGTDCAASGEVCDDTADPVMCVCVDQCEMEGASLCAGDVVQTCMTGASGCLEYVQGDDCTATSQTCADDSGTAMCVGGGGSCAAPVRRSAGGEPLIVAGTDFAADFTDDLELGGTDCRTRTGSAEAVFAVELAARQELLVRELSDVDVVISILPADCGDAVACALSEDLDEEDGQAYQTSAAETVYVVVEEYFDGSDDPYLIALEVADLEMCGDAADNDGDDLTDCDDPDCFGFGPDCTAEVNCGDGEDNDDDGLTDCEDSDDCGADPLCAPASGVWEEFASDNPVDLEGYTVTFMPDSSEPNGYTWTSAPGVTELPEVPGSGTATMTLSLDDDDSAEYVFSQLTSVPFFGMDYGSLWVGDNGHITFGEGATSAVDTVAEFFELPRIGAFATDLDPRDGGTIHVDEYADRVVVTWDAVPEYGTGATNSFQTVIHTDGTIELHFLVVGIPDEGFVGVGDGLANEPYPVMANLVMRPLKINEVVYDDPGADDAELIEIHGESGIDLTGYTLVHYNGDGGGVLFELSLDGVTMPSDGFLVIGDSGVPNLDVDKGSATLQNAEESLALYRDWDSGTMIGTLVDAVAWGVAVDTVPGEGSPAPEIEQDDWNNSIGRHPDAADTDDNAADFVQSWWVTPGGPNTPGQPTGYVRLHAATLAAAGTLPVAIPDDDDVGVSPSFPLPSSVTGTIQDVQVAVQIEHGYRGDLEVGLSSPGGTTVLLHDNTGAGADDIITIYDMLTAPVGNLDDFDGEVLSGSGSWTLTAVDNGAVISGRVVDFVVWLQVN